MDLIRFRDKFNRLSTSLRNQMITDGIAFLESVERPKCRPEHLPHLITFENELQQQLNQKTIPEAWFIASGRSYGPFPFYDAFLRKVVL
jgi:hypothetical protein